MIFKFHAKEHSAEVRGTLTQDDDRRPVGFLVERLRSPGDLPCEAPGEPSVWQYAEEVSGFAMLSRIYLTARADDGTSVHVVLDEGGCELLRKLLALRDAQRIRFDAERAAEKASEIPF